MNTYWKILLALGFFGFIALSFLVEISEQVFWVIEAVTVVLAYLALKAMPTWNARVKLVAVILVVTAAAIFIMNFMHAYLSGLLIGRYQATIDINSTGEANLELFLLILTIPALYVVFETVCESIKGERASWESDIIEFNKPSKPEYWR